MNLTKDEKAQLRSAANAPPTHRTWIAEHHDAGILDTLAARGFYTVAPEAFHGEPGRAFRITAAGRAAVGK